MKQERREGVRWKKTFPGRVQPGKSPGVGTGLVCLKKSRKASVAEVNKDRSSLGGK